MRKHWKAPVAKESTRCEKPYSPGAYNIIYNSVQYDLNIVPMLNVIFGIVNVLPLAWYVRKFTRVSCEAVRVYL